MRTVTGAVETEITTIAGIQKSLKAGSDPRAKFPRMDMISTKGNERQGLSDCEREEGKANR